MAAVFEYGGGTRESKGGRRKGSSEMGSVNGECKKRRNNGPHEEQF